MGVLRLLKQLIQRIQVLNINYTSFLKTQKNVLWKYFIIKTVHGYLIINKNKKLFFIYNKIMKRIPTYEEMMSRLPKDIVQKLKDTEQSPKWHAEGDVYVHSKMVYDEAVKTGNIDLCLAAVFHDLGKIDTHVVKVDGYGKKKISHHKHEYASLKYIEEYFDLYKDLSTNKEKIHEIVKNHMRAHLYTSHQMKRPFKRQQFEKNPYFDEIIEFSGCDERGRIPG